MGILVSTNTPNREWSSVERSGSSGSTPFGQTIAAGLVEESRACRSDGNLRRLAGNDCYFDGHGFWPEDIEATPNGHGQQDRKSGDTRTS